MRVDRRALLLGPAARRVPWAAVGAALVVSSGAVWLRATQVEAPDDLLQLLRLTAVVLAAAGATCLEDGCEAATETTAFGRRRRVVAVVLTGGAVATAFALVIAGAHVFLGTTGTGSWPPLPGLAVELLALSACGWLLASAAIVGFGWRGSAMRAASTLVLVAVCSMAPPVSTWLWVDPGPGPAWRDTHLRLALVGASALAGTVLLGRQART